MASLLSLSTELKLGIIAYLDLPPDTFIPSPSCDLLNLSRTCKTFRTLSLPFLLNSITLLNTQKSSSSVLAILNSPHAHHVRTVHYIAIKALPETCWSDEDAVPPSLDDFPDSTALVLASVGRFPRLARVIVQFACAATLEDDEEMTRSNYDIHEEAESDENVVRAEACSALRSLMKRSYLALSQNSAPGATIKTLELRNVMAKKSSTFLSPSFISLLRGLEEFEISLRAGDNGAGWQLNQVPAYHAFISNLHETFFTHLVHVRRFKFAATASGVPGISGDVMASALLPLVENHMPMLEVLELDNVFISIELAEFIAAHASTLHSVRLAHCYSAWPERTALTWEQFFSTISTSLSSTSTSTSTPHSLHTFTLSIPPSQIEQLSLLPTDPSSYDYPDAQRAQELRKRFPGRRMWDYMYLDDKYGFLSESRGDAFERFEGGGDEEAWVRLQRLIKGEGG